jgi:hypothetical protein
MRNSGKGGEEGAGAGGRAADSSDTEVIEGTGTGGP